MTTPEILQPDKVRFSPIPPDLVILAYLSRSAQPIALKRLQANLGALISGDLVAELVDALMTRGEIAEGRTLRLTPAGQTAAAKALGRDVSESWDNIKAKRLPLLAVGLDPDDADLRRKFARVDALKQAAIAVSFGLPKETMSTPKAVLSEIVWQVLRSVLPGVVGKGPFPLIEAPGHVERAILGGLAGIRAKSIVEAVDALAARAVGLEKASADTLRARLIAIGIERSRQGKPGHPVEKHASPEGINGVSTFAANVSKIASQLVTPPFQDRVAIAQVYDTYGKFFSDAGSLASFKKRLVDAAKVHQIQLGRLDLPERMGKELRDRSETKWDREEVHFVVTA